MKTIKDIIGNDVQLGDFVVASISCGSKNVNNSLTYGIVGPISTTVKKFGQDVPNVDTITIISIRFCYNGEITTDRKLIRGNHKILKTDLEIFSKGLRNIETSLFKDIQSILLNGGSLKEAMNPLKLTLIGL